MNFQKLKMSMEKRMLLCEPALATLKKPQKALDLPST